MTYTLNSTYLFPVNVQSGKIRLSRDCQRPILTAFKVRWITYYFIACCRMLALMFSWLSAMLLDSVSPVVSYSVEMRTQYRPQGCMYGWKWLEG